MSKTQASRRRTEQARPRARSPEPDVPEPRTRHASSAHVRHVEPPPDDVERDNAYRVSTDWRLRDWQHKHDPRSVPRLAPTSVHQKTHPSCAARTLALRLLSPERCVECTPSVSGAIQRVRPRVAPRAPRPLAFYLCDAVLCASSVHHNAGRDSLRSTQQHCRPLPC